MLCDFTRLEGRWRVGVPDAERTHSFGRMESESGVLDGFGLSLDMS